MTFEEIYERIIPLWGKSIEFEDGKSRPQNAVDIPEISPTDERYFSSTKFKKQWNEIEDIVGHKDTFGDLMVWTTYQIFHKHARKLFAKGIYMLNPVEIAKAEIECLYFQNLNVDSWEEELSQYERNKNLL